MTKALSPHTIAAQAGGYVDRHSGGLVPAIQPTSTFARHRDYALLNPSNIYGRDDSDVVRIAEGLLACFENAQDAFLFPSGMAAIAAAIRALPKGATVVLQSQIYWGTTAWMRSQAARRDLLLMEADISDPETLEQLCAVQNPDLVFIETPSNPWLRVTDIARSVSVAHKAGAKVLVDATAATPVLTRALDHGADMVIHSATKAINGHSDVLAGVLATNETDDPWWEAIKMDRHDAGAIIGPFEAWLLIRGMRTLPLRVERMSANAQAIAEFLEGHSAVETVMYPGLHPTDTAKRQMSAFGGLLSVVVKGGADAALAAAGKMNLFHRATSLGGVESLVEHRHSIEPGTGIPPGLLRLSVGIENVNDLIADLDQAL